MRPAAGWYLQGHIEERPVHAARQKTVAHPTGSLGAVACQPGRSPLRGAAAFQPGRSLAGERSNPISIGAKMPWRRRPVLGGSLGNKQNE